MRAGKWLTPRVLLVVTSLIAITALLRLPLLAMPFERDEGGYAYIAWRMQHGELPYRDWVDQKPPGIYWVYRLALAIPMESVRAVHLVCFLFAAASAIALFVLLCRFTAVRWAWLGAVLFAVLSAHPIVQGPAANTEQFMLLPLILSQLSFFRAVDAEKDRTKWMLATGALVGVAVALKHVAAVNLPLLIAIFPFIAAGGNRFRNVAAFSLWSGAAFSGVLAFIAGYFWIHGALSALVENVVTYNLGYISTIPFARRVQTLQSTLGGMFVEHGATWLFAVVGAIALAIKKAGKRFAFLLGWFLTSALAVTASGYNFPHYFQQLLPPFAALAAVGCSALDVLPLWNRLPAAVRTFILLALVCATPMLSFAPYLLRDSPEEAVRRIYPDNAFEKMPDVARRIAALTSPEDRVFVLAAEPEVLFYAQRISATRYIFLFELYALHSGAREKQLVAVREIEQARPAAAFALPNDRFMAPGSEQFFTRWAQNFLQESFVPDTLLTIDAAGTVQLQPASVSPPPGSSVAGFLLVRAGSSAAP